MTAGTSHKMRPQDVIEGTLAPPRNEDFYLNGEFQVEAASNAYFAMMKHFNYPISTRLRDEMWAVDFSLGDFANVGMGGIFWINNETRGYFAHEIFLLPGQMIVEHGHEACDTCGPKHESWHVRHGSIFTFGEGEATNPLPVDLPASQSQYITVHHCNRIGAGEMDELGRTTAKHFMIAGSEGAIVTEYGTFHDNAGLRFTNPGVKF